jgi:hypothetical protein
MLLLLAVAALPVATALAFFVQPRYLILLAALATVPTGAAIASATGRWRHALVAAAAGLLVVSTLQGFRGPGGWWHPADHSDQRAAGEWLAEHTDRGDRIMTRSMVVEYYADREAMAIPYAGVGEILDYGRHYGAQYLVVDWYTAVRLRPQLRSLREVDRVPGLRLVHEVRSEARATRIFAFDPAPAPSDDRAASLGFVGDGAA